MEVTLINKTALVCGASSGIGKAIAIEFAKSGANVVLISRSEDKLSKVLNVLDNSLGQQHRVIPADFTNPGEAIKSISEELKGNSIDIIINNTGGPMPGPVAEAADQEFLSAFNSHLIFSHKLVQEFLPSMKENNFGRIINITSIGAKEPVDNLGVSNTIRGAMTSWSKTLAREVAVYGITINNILPGYTDTERLNGLFENNAKRKGVTPGEIKEETVSRIPAKRLGMPEECGYLAAFLASDKAAYINGANIQIDGAYLHTF